MVLAEQLTIIESAFHQQIPNLEILQDKQKHLLRMSNWWNKVCAWVATVILQQRSPKTQAKTIKKFVKLAKLLIKLRNYSSASQIIAGIQHVAVDRLRKYKEVSIIYVLLVVYFNNNYYKVSYSKG